MKEYFLYLVIFITNIVSLSGYIYIISSDSWIHADLHNYQVSDHRAEVNYGLFSGKYIKPPYLTQIYHLKITCLPQKNACFYSCKSSKNDRQKELRDLLDENIQQFGSNSVEVNERKNETNMITQSKNSPMKTFLNYGLWFSTVFFLVLSLFGCVLLTYFLYLALRKTRRRQLISGMEILNLMGINLFIAVMVTSAGTLFTCQYMLNIRQNIGIWDTLVGGWSNFSAPNVGIAPCLLGPQVILNTFIASILYYNFVKFGIERKGNHSTA